MAIGDSVDTMAAVTVVVLATSICGSVVALQACFERPGGHQFVQLFEFRLAWLEDIDERPSIEDTDPVGEIQDRLDVVAHDDDRYSILG